MNFSTFRTGFEGSGRGKTAGSRSTLCVGNELKKKKGQHIVFHSAAEHFGAAVGAAAAGH